MSSGNQPSGIDIRFLYFEGCPNAAQTRDNLRAAREEAGVEINPQDIEVEPLP